MTKRNEQYWKNRAAQRMWKYMQSAEETADEAAKFYQKAAAYLNQEIDGIFEKYMTKHNLSKREAYDLLNQMTDRASIQELLQKLQNGAKDTEKEQLIQKLEAPAYRARIERLEQIQSQLDQIMRNVYQQELALSTSHYAALAEEAYYKSIFDIQQRSGYGFSFAKVDQKMIDRLLKSRWSGKNYSTRIWNNTGALAQTLKEELLVSLVTGRTERETAAIVMQKFAQGSSQARRLIRTESNYITGQMDLQSYDECGIEKYVYLATLDLRTCQEDCAPLDGKIFPVKDAKPGVNMPPMHPWCRCTTISYFSDEILRSLRRRARDPVTGKTYTVPGDMTYKQWYQKSVTENPEAKQKETETKNMSADRKQYDQYREILESDMPKSFAEFQKMKYNESEKWKFMKLDYQRQHELLEHPELKLPNAENAILPEPKFTKYLFDENSEKGYPKGRAFTDRLGYGMENWQKLQKALKQGAMKYPALYVDNNGYGDRYVQKMILYGEKGTPANVIVAWLKNTDGTTKLTSAYIKEMK